MMVLFLVAVLCVALSAHAGTTIDHSMGMMGACLAVVVVIAVVLKPSGPFMATSARVGPSVRMRAPQAVKAPRGRHPPEDGTALLH